MMKFKMLFLLFSLLLFSTCVTTGTKEPNQNELLLQRDNLIFNFSFSNISVFGEVKFLSGKNDVMIRINDKYLAGEISKIVDPTGRKIVNYSFIYDNKFIRGGYFDDGKLKEINFSLLNKNLSGNITSTSSQTTSIDLLLDSTPITGNWEYSKEQEKVEWNYTIGKKEFNIQISGKRKRSIYDFNNILYNDEEIIIFILLEFMRLQK